MIESSILATPISELLLTASPSKATFPGLAPCCGVLTPQQFDDSRVEIETVLSAAAVHDLGWLRRIAVRGEDRFRWLNGMVTNTVQDLNADSGAWNLVLNSQGRIQGDLHVWRASQPVDTTQSAVDLPSELELELAADQAEKLLAHFEHFIIMDDVELVPVTDQTALGLRGPLADEVLGRLGIHPPPATLTQSSQLWSGHPLLIRRRSDSLVPGYSLWIRLSALHELWLALRSAGALPVGSSALVSLRVAEGTPIYGVDMVERDLPQETSQLQALHFNKGCYLGQEIVERIHSRGNVHRHLRQLELTGARPESGTELTLDGAPVGHLTSIAEIGTHTLALGMVRAEAETSASPLNYSGGTAQLLSAPISVNFLITPKTPSL